MPKKTLFPWSQFPWTVLGIRDFLIAGRRHGEAGAGYFLEVFFVLGLEVAAGGVVGGVCGFLEDFFALGLEAAAVGDFLVVSLAEAG